ncbi:MAG: TonB family protein [Gammaproteobacteria bacterium]|jgi:TonB family protein
MISLMAYALLTGALLGLASLLSDRIMAELGWARRGVWLVALLASVVLPAWSVWMPGPGVVEPGEGIPFAFDFMPGVVPVVFANAVTGAISESWLTLPDWDTFDYPLAVVWTAMSALVLALLCATGFGLYRSLSRADTISVGNQEIVLSDRLGPAVVGFFKPRIVLPRWIAHADAKFRLLVLTHEREHIAARDQLMLLGALLLVACMPWNPVLWWQLKRLRAALEIDCDARVIRRGTDRVDYSNALLSVRQRSERVPFGAVALTEPASQLEQRIRIMLQKARRLSVSRIGIRAATVFSLVVVAFAVEAPLAQQSDGDDGRADGRAVVPTIRTTVYEQLNEAQTCVEAGDIGCARAWLESVSQLDLNEYERAQYWNFMAFVAFEGGDSEAALDAYENVLAQENIPQGLREQVLRSAGALYASSGRHEEAYEKLNQLLELRGIAQVPGLGGAAVSDDEYLPIVNIAPVYPPRAAARGLEGYVIVSFTVSTTGSTEDVVVVESSSTLFERAAIEAASKWKYKPRIVDGQPVAVPGVVNRINFELEPEPRNSEPEA